MLKAKFGILNPLTTYFENGKYVAGYDGVWELLFDSGKQYSFWLSIWDPIKDMALPKGSAKIARIVDYHYEVVSDVDTADYVVQRNGKVTAYKAGDEEIFAHSETPIGSKTEWVIVCNKKRYSSVIREGKTRLYRRIEVNQGDTCIASIKYRPFSKSADFRIDLPLTERIFIFFLANDWYAGEEGDLYDLRL